MIALAGCLLFMGCGPMTPPAVYDRPFSGKLTIRHVSRDEANRICKAHITTRTGRVAGCSMPMGKRCIIIINADTLYDKAAVLRHEIAHCNGWPGDHRR